MNALVVPTTVIQMRLVPTQGVHLTVPAKKGITGTVDNAPVRTQT